MSVQPFQVRIADVVTQNSNFRQVLWTGQLSQVVAMTVPVGGEIGNEVHEDHDQILVFVTGSGESDIGPTEGNQVTKPFEAGDLVVVPANTWHNFRNTGSVPITLYTVYAPPEHADGTVHATKAHAQAAEAAHRAAAARTAATQAAERAQAAAAEVATTAEVAAQAEAEATAAAAAVTHPLAVPAQPTAAEPAPAPAPTVPRRRGLFGRRR